MTIALTPNPSPIGEGSLLTALRLRIGFDFRYNLKLDIPFFLLLR
jgi:hypothetical protein